MLLLQLLVIGCAEMVLVFADEIKYDMQVINVETIEGSEKYFEYNYTLDKVSELNFKVSGNIRQLIQMDNKYALSLKLSRAELNDNADPPVYEEVAALSKPLCEFLTTIYRMYFYEKLKEISNFPHYETCPLPVADYWFKDYAFEGENYRAFMRDGRFKLESYLCEEDAVLGGIITIITVTPVENAK
ncbi:uncharacterized protein LOC128745574 [Sabethes cyaneus]|uniref:uncharacterized protein LOC128745574 n=1 Tax=Sabethes cyaneus TaxID=53552 RepID=UPI00237E8C85|nr:uncharacterized protein LOC128745574 [Sabethes cyaneus]